MQYFVVMIDYGRRGREAVVDPEITRREVVSRVVSGEYGNISFIHEIAGSAVEDVTAEILAEAALPEIEADGADLQADRFDTFATSASTNRRDRRNRFPLQASLFATTRYIRPAVTSPSHEQRMGEV
jgi:hypothetical protein